MAKKIGTAEYGSNSLPDGGRTLAQPGQIQSIGTGRGLQGLARAIAGRLHQETAGKGRQSVPTRFVPPTGRFTPL